jgi:hypothetical protein
MSGIGRDLGDAVVAGRMTLRGLLRRRTSLALLVALPLAFYLARHQHVGQSVRFLALGVAWAVSTAAFFAAAAARDVERRLILGGWSWWSLVAGRVGALLALGAVLSGGYLLLVAVDQPVRSIGGVGLDLATTTVLAVLVGSFLGVVARRELEGALGLFIVAGLQFTADPPSALARVLPFWSTRELGTYAIDGPALGSLGAGLLHAAATALALVLAITVLSRHTLGAGPVRAMYPQVREG